MLSKIRIHSWGGLGSQLFALATAFQVHQKIPAREILLVVHSSGVTFRQLELNFRSDWLRIEFFNDFKDSTRAGGGEVSISFFGFRNFLKRFLFALGFMNSVNTDLELQRLKPWVISVRGHYSHKTIDTDTLRFLAQILDLELLGLESNGRIGVHYRLGDLLTLDSKSFISEKMLVNQLLFLRSTYKLSEIDVVTDSPLAAHDLLKPIGTNLNVFNKETLTTIQQLLNYNIFVGTNSKISIWVTLFRLSADPRSIVFLPSQSREEISRILPTFSSWENLYFFDFNER